MSALQPFHPTSVEEAIDLLSASPLSVDSPTQRRIRGDDHLHYAFSSGRRRPEWVWAVRYADDPRGSAPLGVIAALGEDAPGDRVFVIDHLGLPDDPVVARALVVHATEEAVAAGAGEVGIFAPAGASFSDAALAPLADALTAAGWRLLVERRHYEFEPPERLADADDESVALSFAPPAGPDDPQLAECHREIMRETLDAHDAALVERVGFEQACRESLASLLEADPVDCIRLARDPSGSVVGLVSGRVMAGGRAFVLFVGVCREHRGRGLGRRLLAWQTRELIAGGATVLIADTDNTNLPMARAFAEVGWPQTETRIDLVRG